MLLILQGNTFFKKKNKDRLFRDYKFISILFCVSDVNQKPEEKYNRTSSDLMDKINQNRHRGGMEEGWRVISSFFFSLRFFYLFIYFIFFYLFNFFLQFILFLFFFLVQFDN